MDIFAQREKKNWSYLKSSLRAYARVDCAWRCGQNSSFDSAVLCFWPKRQEVQWVTNFSEAFIHPQTGLDHDCGQQCSIELSAMKHFSPWSCECTWHLTGLPCFRLLEVWLLVRSTCVDLFLIRHVWQFVQQASTKWKRKQWMASNPGLPGTQTFNHK